METKRICPSCSRPLAAGAPQGLCPECLMKAGFGTGVAPEPGEPTNQPPFTPPPVAEMAKLFPQLEIVELLGRGGMGAVYKARQPAIDRWVALKVLPPQSTARPGFTERFNREARALARLNHPNIVALYEFGQVGGMPYFVMEYVEGVTLRRLVQQRRLEPHEALKIVPQICEALQFAHDEGVVHRDIKPENILLDKKGRVKIADFGIAKIMGGTAPAIPSPGLTATLSPSDGERAGVRGEGLTQDQVLGTPNYMAPEQVEHPQTVDHRADIYSLGVVFYEMLTGELPLGKFAPPSRRVKVDVRLDEVVLQALEKEPERRYQTAAQFKTGVETISSSSSPVTGTAASPARPAATRGRLRAALFVGVLVWLFVTGTVTLITWIRPESWKAVAVISCPLKLPPGHPVEEHFKFITTMIELMRSDFILGRVIDRLKLDERWGKRDNGGLKLTQEQTTVLLKRRLDVRSEGGTLIQVGVFGKRPEEPEEAIEIANTIGEELRALRIEQHDSPADVLEITLRFTPPDILLGIAVGFVLGLLVGGLVLLRGFLRRASQASQVKTAVETISQEAAQPPKARPSAAMTHQSAQAEMQARLGFLEQRRRGMLWFGFLASVAVLPIGLALKLPAVCVLAALGIIVGGYKLGCFARGGLRQLLHSPGHDQARDSQQAGEARAPGERALRKALKRVGWRLLFVFVIQVALLEALDRASVHWKESTSELWTMALLAGSLPGLIWAFWPGFRLSGWRLLSAGGTIVSLFVLLTLDNLYNWHVRPNLGLYQEEDWVAQHPGFQRELRQRIQKNLWRKPAAAPPTTGNRKPEGPHRKFVRLVVDQTAMTFEGQPTTWAGVGALLDKVTDRANTVLECAVTSDHITVQQQNEWTFKCQGLAQELGFEYASFIGIHPLGSKGTPRSD